MTFHPTRLFMVNNLTTRFLVLKRKRIGVPQLLKVTNNTEFSNYVSANHFLNNNSAADDEVDDGYFSNETLPEDERDEVTDEDFLRHLVTPDSLGVNDRKHPHKED